MISERDILDELDIIHPRADGNEEALVNIESLVQRVRSLLARERAAMREAAARKAEAHATPHSSCVSASEPQASGWEYANVHIQDCPISIALEIRAISDAEADAALNAAIERECVPLVKAIEWFTKGHPKTERTFRCTLCEALAAYRARHPRGTT